MAPIRPFFWNLSLLCCDLIGQTDLPLLRQRGLFYNSTLSSSSEKRAFALITEKNLQILRDRAKISQIPSPSYLLKRKVSAPRTGNCQISQLQSNSFLTSPPLPSLVRFA